MVSLSLNGQRKCSIHCATLPSPTEEHSNGALTGNQCVSDDCTSRRRCAQFVARHHVEPLPHGTTRMQLTTMVNDLVREVRTIRHSSVFEICRVRGRATVINLSRQGLTKTNIPGEPLMSICSGLDRLTRASFLLQQVEGTSSSKVSAKRWSAHDWGVARRVSQATSCDGGGVFVVLKDSGDVAHVAVIQHYQCWTVWSLGATSAAQKSGRTTSSLNKRSKKGTAQAQSLQHIIFQTSASPPDYQTAQRRRHPLSL